MGSIKVGFFTIGQSPREDVISEIRPLLLPQIEIYEEGLLDGLPPEGIDLLKPGLGEIPLITRLRDGSQVLLSEEKVSSLIHEALDNMRKTDIRATGVLCTHDFQLPRLSYPVIFPHDYIHFLITRAFRINSLGVVVPLEGQVEIARKKWEVEIAVTEVKSPYGEGKEWEEIAQKFTQEKVEAVVLDCMGFRMQDKQQLQNLLPCPILLPRAILAQAINQLF
ncbi:MAG: AroM family protein [Candidatus Aminicenantes bacterium]|nr:AroM family protein [Candidatus Aminicenantes bacterium]MDH5707107.1 AroM family protein [Candidatus Aminicenantes bacterium]